MIAAWCIRADRRWTRVAAVCGFTLLLPAFPWLTLVGLLGICAAFLPTDTHQASVRDIRQHEFGSGVWHAVLGILVGVGLLVGDRWILRFGHELGLPNDMSRWTFWPALFAGELVIVVTHELAHALAAWSLRFRIVTLSMGPRTLRWDIRGHVRVSIDCARAFGLGGYTGSVPRLSEQGTPANYSLIVAAGPACTALLALVLWLLFVISPWHCDRAVLENRFLVESSGGAYLHIQLDSDQAD